MDRRYQVFLSSTFEDLLEERIEVIQALLELDCLPAAMELFPAANETQWNWIKKVIDESDYYIVVIGGRYGSVHPETGVSYTEMEYRYALESGTPTLAFVHEDPGAILASKTEQSEANRERLREFREFCQTKLCKTWSSPADLAAKVSRSMVQLIKREPAIGWVRADRVELNRFVAKQSNSSTEQSNLEAKTKLELPNLDAPCSIEFSFSIKQAKTNKRGRRYWVQAGEYWANMQITWRQIIFVLGPEILDEVEESRVCATLNSFAYRVAYEKNPVDLDEGLKIESVRISKDSIRLIRMQLLAFDFISIANDTRDSFYCYVTDSGEQEILQLHIAKNENANPDSILWESKHKILIS